MQGSYLVQDRHARVWGTAVVETVLAEAYVGRFSPTPDFYYLRSLFEEYETQVRTKAADMTRIGELFAQLVALRPRLVPMEGDELQLLCVLIGKTDDGFSFTGIRYA
jgi:hypothetical protein